jgi:hypothetical protein
VEFDGVDGSTLIFVPVDEREISDPQGVAEAIVGKLKTSKLSGDLKRFDTIRLVA